MIDRAEPKVPTRYTANSNTPKKEIDLVFGEKDNEKW